MVRLEPTIMVTQDVQPDFEIRFDAQGNLELTTEDGDLFVVEAKNAVALADALQELLASE